MYRLLMSGEPQLCASLISDGLEDDPPEQKTKLFAISSNFDAGFERVKRFVDIVLNLATQTPFIDPPKSASLPAPASLMGRLRQMFSSQRATGPAGVAAALAATSTQLSGWLIEAVAFLESHRNTHLLLETIELDCMSEDEELALRACVEREVARCSHVGAAIDALPTDIGEAGILLREATTQKLAVPLDAFFGLRLDDECDSTRSGATQYPLGLEWSEHLYFGLLNRSEYEARTSQAANGTERSPMSTDDLARFQLFQSYLGRQDDRMRFLPGFFGGPSNRERLAYLAKDSKEVHLFLGIKSPESDGSLQLDMNSLGGFMQFSEGWMKALIRQLEADADTAGDAQTLDDAWARGILMTVVLLVRPGDSGNELALLRVEAPPRTNP